MVFLTVPLLGVDIALDPPRGSVIPGSVATDAGLSALSEGVEQSPGDVKAATWARDSVAPVIRVQASVGPDVELPAASGTGRRVIFSESRQRVWLVADDGTVEATYQVSGSVYPNLDPGTYEVYSRSERATSFDGGSTMAYFVRFTQGDRGNAIGFHDIPATYSGDLVQSVDELGIPMSHGCIRQARDDAIRLWEFAPIGTTVVVTA
ncbi:MAG: L,D-transpeptidase [Nocardioides sp.]